MGTSLLRKASFTTTRNLPKLAAMNLVLAFTAIVALGITLKFLLSQKQVSAGEFDLQRLRTSTVGTHGEKDFRVFYEYRNESRGDQWHRISPWHDIPLLGSESGTFHFVCEIPKGTNAKFEINKDQPDNPIAQDLHKDGSLRSYKYGPSLVNYGAIPQTWEDPEHVQADTAAGGDNDPVDVLQLNEQPCTVGQVYTVRVLGTLALLDHGETDWKIIVVDSTDPDTDHLRDIEDVPTAKVHILREWFRNYKTAEGKGLNVFALDERAMPKQYSEQVVYDNHESWKRRTKYL